MLLRIKLIKKNNKSIRYEDFNALPMPCNNASPFLIIPSIFNNRMPRTNRNARKAYKKVSSGLKLAITSAASSGIDIMDNIKSSLLTPFDIYLLNV